MVVSARAVSLNGVLLNMCRMAFCCTIKNDILTALTVQMNIYNLRKITLESTCVLRQDFREFHDEGHQIREYTAKLL